MPFRRHPHISIEINDNVIRFVELKSTDPIVVKRYGERYIPDGIVENGKIIDLPQFNQFITECISHWKLKGKKIFFVEPDESVIIKTITIPSDIVDEEIQGYLYLELGESIILPFEDPSISFEVLSDSEAGKEILLVATPFELVSSYASSFRKGRANPVAVDIAPLCYYRLYMNQIEVSGSGEEVLMLQVDVSSATLSIFEHHVPIFMQYEGMFIDGKWVSGDLVDGDIQATWEGNQENMSVNFDNLIGDIARILHFYQFSISQGNTIKKIVVVGENPFLESFVENLAAALEVPVQTIPNAITTVHGDTVPQKYQLTIGLGLKEVRHAN